MTRRFSALFFFCLVIGLSMGNTGQAAAKKKVAKKAAPASKVVATPTPGLPKVLDLMELAKASASKASDDAKFGEAFGEMVSKTLQERTYHPLDPRFEQLLVVFRPGKTDIRGVALVTNTKNPLSLRDVERVFGQGKEIKGDPAPGFVGLSFAKISGDYTIEPIAYVQPTGKDLKKTDSIFRLLLRRNAP